MIPHTVGFLNIIAGTLQLLANLLMCHATQNKIRLSSILLNQVQSQVGDVFRLEAGQICQSNFITSEPIHLP